MLAVEHGPFNHGVVGSSPTALTNKINSLRDISAAPGDPGRRPVDRLWTGALSSPRRRLAVVLPRRSRQRDRDAPDTLSRLISLCLMQRFFLYGRQLKPALASFADQTFRYAHDHRLRPWDGPHLFRSDRRAFDS
jgi:hypothetical protein